MEYGSSGKIWHVLIVYCIIVLLQCCHYVVSEQTNYVWETGPWGKCEHYSCGEGGQQRRYVWCKNRAGFTSPDYDCNQSQKPPSIQLCFKVCEEHRSHIRWASTPWSACMLSTHVETCTKGSGVQKRNVTCVWRNNGTVLDDTVCSHFVPKPISIQNCKYYCPQDCIVSDLSEWSDCDTCLSVNSSRTREVIIPPSYGGKPCPPLSEMRACDECQTTYKYSVREWGPCIPYNSPIQEDTILSQPVIGYQRRDIFCVHSTGSIVSPRFCLDSLPSVEVQSLQACIIPQHCIVSNWTNWQHLNNSCINDNNISLPGSMIRSRDVRQIPLGDGKPCPPLEERFEVTGTSAAKCKETKWILSAWSYCEPAPGVSGCGTGLQHRKAICVEVDQHGAEKPIDSSRCQESYPLTSKPCRVECHFDCSVSEWSSWSKCKVKDCEDYARKRRTESHLGQRYRTREILTFPGNGGKACPHLSETQACEPEPCYSWNITEGTCLLYNDRETCGSGVMHKTIACVNRYGLRVANSLCAKDVPKPPEQEMCTVPCPYDCVISSWTSWSSCPEVCQTGTTPTVRRRNRLIIAFPSAGGKQCLEESTLMQAETCPLPLECSVYMWRTSSWGKCHLENEMEPCGTGRQRREVSCYNRKGQLVAESRCAREARPVNKQVCEVPCPSDCQVTEWSEWSSCSATCWEAKQVIPIQTRKRYILQPALNGGARCPMDLTDAQQCLKLPPCHGFVWDASKWSNCLIPPRVPQCGSGLRGRQILCKHENGSSHSLDVCLKNIGPIPPMTEKCYKSCDDECNFTEWSEFSSCVGGCHGYRFKTRELTGQSQYNRKCKDHKLHPLDDREACLCDTLNPVTIGNWSECIIGHHQSKRNVKERIYQQSLFSKQHTKTPQNETLFEENEQLCGTGKMFKVIACKNDYRDMDEASKCSHEEYEEEVCIVPCPVDCVMSEWMVWSSCSVSCGTGIQMRSRTISRTPSNGGRQCPLLDHTQKPYPQESQTKLCHMECTQYNWQASEWGVCIPAQSSCGRGAQTRQVRCTIKQGNGGLLPNTVVSDSHCTSLHRPEDRQVCYLPCAGQCVVSLWSEWTPCKQPCNSNQKQQRYRKILRPSAKARGYDCPDLVESQPCIEGRNCIEYTWELSDWTSCLINSGNSECGVGHKQRYSLCRDRVGNIVDGENCQKVHGLASEPLVMSCEVPCDVDCLLSGWSQWTSCSKSCGLGRTSRYRHIVQKPIGNGRLCPENENQNKPCFRQGCYTWEVTDWSPCISQEGICGNGTQYRNITCVGDDGLPVLSSRCNPDLNISVLEKSKQCYIPCPGDCMMTEWTSWNDCYISCDDYLQGHRDGIQTRSRAITSNPSSKNPSCPDQLWEKRGCSASQCFTFQWRTSAWDVSKSREVWCSRSDGFVNVTGGCNPALKPPSYLSCTTPCVANSYCEEVSFQFVCVCRNGFTPQYEGVNLIACVTMTIANNVTTPASVSEDLEDNGPKNFWMYAVLAAGTLFIIFVAVALYTMCEMFRTGPRPRNKQRANDDERASLQNSQNANNNGNANPSQIPNHILPDRPDTMKVKDECERVYENQREAVHDTSGGSKFVEDSSHVCLPDVSGSKKNGSIVHACQLQPNSTVVYAFVDKKKHRSVQRDRAEGSTRQLKKTSMYDQVAVVPDDQKVVSGKIVPPD